MYPYFYLFMHLLLVFFSFLSKCKYDRIKLCYNRLQFVKQTQISTVSNRERRAKIRFFFIMLLGANYTTIWGQTSKSYRTSYLTDARIVWLYDYDINDLQSPWKHHENTSRWYILHFWWKLSLNLPITF